MAVRTVPIQTDAGVANGSAMAAFLGAGIGAFSMGAGSSQRGRHLCRADIVRPGRRRSPVGRRSPRSCG